MLIADILKILKKLENTSLLQRMLITIVGLLKTDPMLENILLMNHILNSIINGKLPMINFTKIKVFFPDKTKDASANAYLYCKHIKDSPLVYRHVISSWCAYHYCKYVKDRPEVRKFITYPNDAYDYCRTVKDRPSIRQFITDSFYAYKYCKYIKDRPDVRKLITDSNDAYFFCRYIKDRPSTRQYITKEEHLKNYREWKDEQ